MILIMRNLLLFTAITYLNTIGATYHGKVVTCYVQSWSRYRIGNGAFDLSYIEPQLCTHIIFAFLKIDEVNHVVTARYPDVELEENGGQGWLRKITDLKSATLKVLLSVGGWGIEGDTFSTMARTHGGRVKFARSAVEYVRRYNFDGFDLAWILTENESPDTKSNLVLLLKELRELLTKENLLLTAAINGQYEVISASYNVPSISHFVNFLHVMSFSYNGYWNDRFQPNAPLWGTGNRDVESTIKLLIESEAPAELIVVGIPVFGRSFIATGIEPVQMNHKTESFSFSGPFTREEGLLGYNEICKELENENWKIFWDNRSWTPYAVNGRKIISFENDKSIRMKVETAMMLKTGGFMLWAIDLDVFLGNCAFAGFPRDDILGPDTYPILKAVRRSIKQYTTTSPPRRRISTGSATLFGSCTEFLIAMLVILFAKYFIF